MYATPIGPMKTVATTLENASRTAQSVTDLSPVIVMNALKTRPSMNTEYAAVMITTLIYLVTHVVCTLDHVTQSVTAVLAQNGVTVSTAYITQAKTTKVSAIAMTGGRKPTAQSTRASVTASVTTATETKPATATSAQKMPALTIMATVSVTLTGMATAV